MHLRNRKISFLSKAWVLLSAEEGRTPKEGAPYQGRALMIK